MVDSGTQLSVTRVGKDGYLRWGRAKGLGTEEGDGTEVGSGREPAGGHQGERGCVGWKGGVAMFAARYFSFGCAGAPAITRGGRQRFAALRACSCSRQ